MKTLDLANSYLKKENLKKLRLFSTLEEQDKELITKLQHVKEFYLKDTRNKVSNETYREVVFEIAVNHNAFIQQNMRSPLSIAMEIIDKHYIKLKLLKFFGQKDIPKFIAKLWEERQKIILPTPTILKGGDFSFEILHVAYFYKI